MGFLGHSLCTVHKSCEVEAHMLFAYDPQWQKILPLKQILVKWYDVSLADLEKQNLEKQNLNFIPIYNQTILNIKHTPRTVEP